MNVAVAGTGYVGLVLGAALADSGNRVVCVDVDHEKIVKLRRGEVPFYEPRLEELVKRNAEKGRLLFTTDLGTAVRESLVIFIAVGTPQGEDGSADVDRVLECGRTIAQSMDGYKLVVVKSTVPVGTCELLEREMRKLTSHPFDVASNPEFLKEGDAVRDMLKPDRIVIGTDSERAKELLRELYAPYVRTGNPILFMDVRSSEMTKYAANAILAARISLMNEIARLCDAVGADVELVRQGVGKDPRIGSRYLFPGVGYGGSCFPKDVRALMATGRKASVPTYILEAVDRVNEAQKRLLVDKVCKHFGTDLSGLCFAVWGLSFKPETDDMREAPSVTVIRGLCERGAKVKAYDPVANHNAAKVLHGVDGLELVSDAYAATFEAEALLLVTEWQEFRKLDLKRLRDSMRGRAVFDGRNIWDPDELAAEGFQYHGIGRGRGYCNVCKAPA